uniref:Sclerostin domain containing 1b n=1 Tax=Petromyzon marinus TaxID=7757 RepID=S4RPL3_PETMA
REASLACLDKHTNKAHLGCRELRSTKYVSDGDCTSVTPVKEVVCAGECLPTALLPNWAGSRHFWRRRGGEDGSAWRCVAERSRTQRVRLTCGSGETRTYRIQVVASCKCKRMGRQQNAS